MGFVNRTDWVDYPDESTPIMAADMLRIEAGIAGAYGRTGTFVDADLVSGGMLNIKHDFGEEAVVVIIKNSLKRTVEPDEVIDIDANNVTVDLSSYTPLSGTWRYRVAL